ncbi:MAG: sensor histidine kinase [Saprospiraceae bacterium]
MLEKGWLRWVLPAIIGLAMFGIVHIMSQFEAEQFSWAALLVFCGVFYIIWSIGIILHRRLDRYLSWKERGWRRFFIQLGLFLCINLLIFEPFYIILKHFLIWYMPQNDTVSYKHVLVTSLGIVIITFLVYSVQMSLFFVEKWKQEALRAEQLQKESIQAELNSLKHQISPHFLFNSLNILTELIDETPDLAKDYVNKLAETYRYVLKNRNTELVLLQEELEFLEAYLYLLKKRFGDNLQVCLQIDPAAQSLYLPPLTLQLLVENAVKHNVLSAHLPLQLDIYTEYHNLWVKNKLQRRSDTANTGKTGLENIRRRYRYLSELDIHIMETSDFFMVQVPLLQAEA